MSTAEINQIKLYQTKDNSWWYLLSKKIVLRFLEKLKYGKLIIEENNQIMYFGLNNSDDDLTAKIIIHNPRVYSELLFNGSIGSGEAFMSTNWSSDNLVDVIRIFCRNIDTLNSFDQSRFSFNKILTNLLHRLNKNSVSGSKKNISMHYDLSNDFFKLFLDSKLMYSAAIYPTINSTLDTAAEYKLDVICKKLRLKPNEHLLEIGTGWGGLAIHAAKKYGCHVTTTTISQQQYNYVFNEIKKAYLTDKITLLKKDYRELTGKFDKLVSVEMIEAVGHQHYQQYFSLCSNLLSDQGLMLIQAITIPDQRYRQALKSVDFIQRYIFPGGSLPCNEIIARFIARHTDMQLICLKEIGLDYARTLHDWRLRFLKNLPQVKALGFDDRFCKMWQFYLSYCEGGFLERSIGTSQLLFAKPRTKLD